MSIKETLAVKGEALKIRSQIRYQKAKVATIGYVKGTLPDQQMNVSVPFYYRDGFKRTLGLIGYGMVKIIYPPAGEICEVAEKVFGGLFGAGVVHAAAKSGPQHQGSEGIFYKVWSWIKKIIQLLFSSKTK